MAKHMYWSPEAVGKFWAGVARTRLSELSFSKHNAEHLIEVMAPYLKPQGRHLDFGAGDGDLVKALIHKGYPTAAYEPAQARASKILAEMTAHPKFLGLAGSDAPQRFDAVLMVEVIEHILEPDLEEVFQTVRSLLATDGALIVTTPLAEDLELGSAYCPCCDTVFHRWQHVRSFTAESVEAFLRRYGFEPLVVREVDFSGNRLLTEDLRSMNEEINDLYGRLSRTFGARIKRLLTGQREERTRFARVSLTGSPTHLFYVGKPQSS